MIFGPLVSLLLCMSAGFARDPGVARPDSLSRGEFTEGTLTRLDPEDVEHLVPWARNAKALLEGAQREARGLPLNQRAALLDERIRVVVRESGGRQYQTLMRFALNRGLLLAEDLRTRTAGQIGAHEGVIDVLHRSIDVALAFYQSDLDFQQNGQMEVPYASFAVVFLQSLNLSVNNVLDASAQYRLLYLIVEMANWDLSRDTAATSHATIITDTVDVLRKLPTSPRRSAQDNLGLIRQLRSLNIFSLPPQAGLNPTISCLTSLEFSHRIPLPSALPVCLQRPSLEDMSCINTLLQIHSITPTESAKYCLEATTPEFGRCMMEQSFAWNLNGKLPPEISIPICLGGTHPDYPECIRSLLKEQFAQGRTIHQITRGGRGFNGLSREVAMNQCERYQNPNDPPLLAWRFYSCVNLELNYTRRRDKGSPQMFAECHDWAEKHTPRN